MRRNRSRHRRRTKKFSRNLNAWQAQYKDPRWLTYRKQILERDEHKCQKCGNCGVGVTLHVHHKKYYGKHIWDVLPKDLITLCKVCHNLVHNRKF